jgi:tetratricopeptide (TPR) repeat protein
MLNWLNTKDATDVGTELADDFVFQTTSAGTRRSKKGSEALQSFLGNFLQVVDRKARPLQLNLLKRAKLANSFKWRLLEKGVEQQVVEELTQALVLRLTVGQSAMPSPTTAPEPSAAPGRKSGPARRSAETVSATALRNAEALLIQGGDFISKGDYEEAAKRFRQYLELDPRHPLAYNNLGVALIRLGQYEEAEAQFRRAIGIKDNYPDAQCNLGTLLRSTGRIVEAEMPLRRALKLKPTYVEAQISLGLTLLMLSRPSDARTFLERALKSAPTNVDALAGLGEVAMQEGRFADAEALYKRALAADPRAGGAWVGLVGLRKMTPADGDWLKGAEGSLVSGLAPVSEGSIRFAIGKYYDDLGQFGRAFDSYRRANELWKVAARPYSRVARTNVVDALIRTYPREVLCGVRPGASDSTLPLFVVGMPRSGTSLVEQIVASHHAVTGAGELDYWNYALRKHETALLEQPPDQALTGRLADAFLRVLAQHRAQGSHVIDKSTVNSDFLGPILCVFPNARVIYVRRDPIDVCLSCYFQPFAPSLSFTFDLSDLAHYYREHVRLMSHWRSVLPPHALLEVPYEELVTDQERWTRRMLEFLDLPWDESCLRFHETDRRVGTASVWQVRQKMYRSSVNRWRNYEKFIGPLRQLRDLRA